MKWLKNKVFLIVVLSLIFVVLISLTYKRDEKSSVENGIGLVFSKIGGVFYNINKGVDNLVDFAKNFSEVKQENEDLKKENAELKKNANDMDRLQRQVDECRAMFEIKSQNDTFEFIGCNIITRGDQGVYETYTIDKGSKDGVLKDTVIITSDGLVGKVTMVSDYYSIFQTIISENSSVGVMVERSAEYGGILTGYKVYGKKNLAKISYLDKQVDVQVGDTVSTSGVGYLFPKGIRVGVVEEVQDDPDHLEKTVIVKPYVEFNKLETVFFVKSKEGNPVTYEGEIK